MEQVIEFLREYIVPTLVSLLAVLSPFIIAFIKAKLNESAIRSRATAKAMDAINNREDMRPAVNRNSDSIDKNSEELAQLQNIVAGLAKINMVAFSKSGLSEEDKLEIQTIYNEALDNSKTKVIEELTNAKNLADEKIEALTQQLEEKAKVKLEKTAEKITKRIRG